MLYGVVHRLARFSLVFRFRFVWEYGGVGGVLNDE